MTKVLIKRDGDNRDLSVIPDKELAYSSDYNCLKETLSGTVDITTNGSGVGSSTVSHSLGYKPNFFAFIRDPDNTGRWYPHMSGFPTVTTSVDNNTLYLDVLQDASKTYRVFYVIFLDQQDGESGSGATGGTSDRAFKIARSGQDVSNTNERFLQFTAARNVLKLDTDISGEYSVSVTPPAVVTRTITHNFGYVPIVFCFTEADLALMPVGNATLSHNYYVTSAEVVIETADFTTDPAYTDTFQVHILKDKIV